MRERGPHETGTREYRDRLWGPFRCLWLMRWLAGSFMYLVWYIGVQEQSQHSGPIDSSVSLSLLHREQICSPCPAASLCTAHLYVGRTYCDVTERRSKKKAKTRNSGGEGRIAQERDGRNNTREGEGRRRLCREFNGDVLKRRGN